MSPPGLYELIAIAAWMGIVAGVVWLVVRLARKGRPPGGSPAGQQPPAGSWWDGEKWNPPEPRSTERP